MRKLELAVYLVALQAIIDKQYNIFDLPRLDADAQLIVDERDKTAAALVAHLREGWKPT